MDEMYSTNTDRDGVVSVYTCLVTIFHDVYFMTPLQLRVKLLLLSRSTLLVLYSVCDSHFTI